MQRRKIPRGIDRAAERKQERQVILTSRSTAEMVHAEHERRGGLAVSGAARLRALEAENRRLKKLLAESMLDVSALKDLLEKTHAVCGTLRCRGEADGRYSFSERRACRLVGVNRSA